MADCRPSRRTFLAAGAAVSAGLPTFLSKVSRAQDKASPSERLVMGCIGTGGKGRNNMETFLSFGDVHVKAVCDVDANHARMAKEKVDSVYGNQDCKSYSNFLEMLADPEIDVVSIATPDHWHAVTSVAAANAGKDIYCEKPLANSVGEGRAIADAVKKNDRVLQCGSHERSTPSIRFACELVRSGRIGDLNAIEVNLPTNDPHHKQCMDFKGIPAEQPIPEGFDYDYWLGHTPVAPYSDKRCHFWWRFILNYGGGEMTDRGAHVIDIAQLGAGMDDTGPVEFIAKGQRNPDSLYDAFWNFEFENTYANGLKLIGTSNAPRGLKFIGKEGWIFVHIHGGKLEASSDNLLSIKPETLEVQLGRSPGHHRNFIDCVKSREATMATAEIGHRTATICHLNNIAMILGRPVRWDPAAEEIVGDAEANALLMPSMREKYDFESMQVKKA